MAVQYRILGPLVAEADGKSLDLGGDRQRAVLAALLLQANRFVRRDRLLEDLWEDTPHEKALNSMQSCISRLRQRLASSGPPELDSSRLLVHSKGAYSIQVGLDELDSLRFEHLAEEGRRALEASPSDPATAAATLREALSLWRGDVLEDLRHEGLDLVAISQLEYLRQVTLAERIQADLLLGRHHELVGEVRAEVDKDPLNERMRHHLMLALYRAGRQADAVDVYQDLRSRLDKQRGMKPGKDLQELHRAIHRQEPSLDWHPPSGGATVRTLRTLEHPSQVRPRQPKLLPVQLLGREVELGILHEALHSTRAGHGQLLLISGELGIGKSYLARKFADEAEEADAEALWGRIWEEEGAPYLWPWVQMIDLVLQSRERGWLLHEIDEPQGVLLARLVPGLAMRLPELRKPLTHDPTEDRLRLFEAVSLLFRRAATERPLVIVLDDLHRADEPTLALLRFLARQSSDANILIVGTYRDTLRDQPRELLNTLDELRREPSTRELQLQGLNTTEIPLLLLIGIGAEQLPGKLHALTGGNPLQLKQLLLPLARDANFHDFEQQLDPTIPVDLQGAIERRLKDIPVPVRDVLDAASVIGALFSAEVLAHVTGLSLESVRRVLDEAIGLELVEEVPVFTRYRFSHSLIRETLYSNLSAERQRALHYGTGRALEVVYETELESRVTELAHHFAQAAYETGSREALNYLYRAGKQAMGLLAYGEAVRWLTMAMRQPADRLQRCQILLTLANAQMRTGDVARARSNFLQAADTAKALGDPERFAQAALGYGGGLVESEFINRQLIELLQEAASLLQGRHPDLGEQVADRLTRALSWTTG